MDPNGDITDAFDDEDLKRSIEAGEKGPWNDEQARFRDPKLEELERQLKEPKARGYRERRMAELQARGIRERRKQAEAEARAAARQSRPKPAPNNTSFGDPATFGEPATFRETEQWGEPATFSESAPRAKPKPPAKPKQKAPWLGDDTPPSPPTAKGVPSEPAAGEWPAEPAAFRDSAATPKAEKPGRSMSSTAPAPTATPAAEAVAETAVDDAEPIRVPAESSVLIAYAPSIFASTLVFVAATLVHGSLEGWHQDLVYRAVIAMLVTGVLWRRFQSGRLRATTIAVTTYLTVFVASNRLDQPESQVALFLGLLVVVAGSGLIGVQRDEFGEQTL